MKKYIAIKLLLACIYISILLFTTFFNNIFITSTVGISIIILDKFIVSDLKDLKEKFNEKEKIKKYFKEIREFLEYLFSSDYLNEGSHISNIDERVISELSIIRDKEKEMKKYFILIIRKDEPSQYNKQLSFLKGKWIFHFRNHKPFQSNIYLDDKLINPEEGEIRNILDNFYEELRDLIKASYNINI